MAELQEIEVLIRPDGTVKLKVRGIKGARCREITAGLERVLGGQVVTREHTAEFNEVSSEEQDRRDEQHLQDRIGHDRNR